MPSWKEIERFCRRDGWEEFKKKGHHIYFMKIMDDGNVKRVKISRGTGEVRGHLWQKILKKELQVTQEEFNDKK